MGVGRDLEGCADARRPVSGRSSHSECTLVHSERTLVDQRTNAHRTASGRSSPCGRTSGRSSEEYQWTLVQQVDVRPESDARLENWTLVQKIGRSPNKKPVTQLLDLLFKNRFRGREKEI
ncbi:hypothetical protein LR48_Vigan08g095000 [Vigna angularis]|uniref:Uncharacterized protein n=1 Tax=Phaseolus angularis TaxID=3914 RepID=A0A0L9V596_PHAAN|nr:hypothetical protein LR48_Vigan08g095000 [Vigna angularis]